MGSIPILSGSRGEQQSFFKAFPFSNQLPNEIKSVKWGVKSIPGVSKKCRVFFGNQEIVGERFLENRHIL